MTEAAEPAFTAPEAAEHRARTSVCYAAFLKALHEVVRTHPDEPTENAIAAAGDIMADMAAASGLLASSPDMVENFRCMVAELERKRAIHRTVLPTLREFFDASRPSRAN